MYQLYVCGSGEAIYDLGFEASFLDNTLKSHQLGRYSASTKADAQQRIHFRLYCYFLLNKIIKHHYKGFVPFTSKIRYLTRYLTGKAS